MPPLNPNIPNSKICLECKIQYYRIRGQGSDKDWTKRKYCSPKCAQKHFSETRKKQWEDPKYRKMMVDAHRGERPKRRGVPLLHLRGAKNHRWKGGITGWQRKIRTSIEYKTWRRMVFDRDNYTCVMCGNRSKKGNKVLLHADHIKPFALFPDLRTQLTNGRTLCYPCHKTTFSHHE